MPAADKNKNGPPCFAFAIFEINDPCTGTAKLNFL